MPLRRRLSLVAAAAVAVAVALVVLISYFVVRDQLRGQVDSALTAQASRVAQGDTHALGDTFPGLSANAGGPAPFAQFVSATGAVYLETQNGALPVTQSTLAVAAGKAPMAFTDLTLNGVHLREITAPFPGASIGGEPVAIQLARPLTQVDSVLSSLRLVLFLLFAGGIALAAALGRIAARRVLRPLAEVARSAEHISETEDLSTRLRVHAEDEVGQLARRFNAMIERLQRSRDELDESVLAQRQLVADASHELRTPVTSLRTNVEVLLAGAELAPADRDRLLADVVEQTEELSALVNDLIEVARGDLPLSQTGDVRLDRVVADAVARAHRDAPGVHFETTLRPVVVRGVAERLARAIGNLLDNAARHSPPGGVIDVTADEHGVRVRDHGTGIEPADLPHIFERFYRGVNARGRQGSGLGLAIVRQVAEQHGGSVSAENATGGGALMTIELPTLPVAPAPPEASLTPVATPGRAPDGPR
jgi:two-component system sensor histidine kinase MprB